MPSAKNSIEGVWHTAVVGACFETMACVKPISWFGKSSELSPVGLGMVLRILLEIVGVLSLLCGVRSVQSVGVGKQCLYERSPLLWVPRVDEVCCGSGSLRWRWLVGPLGVVPQSLVVQVEVVVVLAELVGQVVGEVVDWQRHSSRCCSLSCSGLRDPI